MTSLRILFLGGTGTISAACVRAARDAGHDVTVLNRGNRLLAEGVRGLIGDVRDPEGLRAALDDERFDVVADFLTYTPVQMAQTLGAIGDRIGQYVFVSTASAYEKPVRRLPVTEETPLVNPFWQYSRDKAAAEAFLATQPAPWTVVRPSHTYDDKRLVSVGKWTDVVRMRAGKPVVVLGDGTSLWTVTHADDFAVAFTGLLGNEAALGEAFTITGDHSPSWGQIYRWIGEAAGVPDPAIVHLSSDAIAAFRPDLGPGLLGDKSHPMVFDTAKVRALMPAFGTTITYDEGARRTVANLDAHPELQTYDPELDAAFDRMVAWAATAG